PPRRHPEARVAQHRVDLVAPQARGVDEMLGPDRPPPGLDLVASSRLPDAGHRSVQHEAAAHSDGLGCEGERRGEGTDDALSCDLERTLRPRAEVGLARVELLELDSPGVREPVLATALLGAP